MSLAMIFENLKVRGGKSGRKKLISGRRAMVPDQTKEQDNDKRTENQVSRDHSLGGCCRRRW